jgi:acetylornithine deacetylase/succinyl-diaminopimelate desuccinylase-like protein
VSGFYDDVVGMPNEEWSVLDHTFDKSEFQKHFGIRVFGGEAGYSLHESNWIRPTLEINGMWGGYTGSGFKTVIPSSAHAKISCRLVPNQEPDTIAKRVIEHFRRSLPSGMEMTYEIHPGGLPAYSSSESMVAKIAKEAYTEVFAKPCQFIVSSASVPIVAELVEATGAEMILMGTATAEDDIHAPNEHFGLRQYERGFLVIGRIFSLLNQS